MPTQAGKSKFVSRQQKKQRQKNTSSFLFSYLVILCHTEEFPLETETTSCFLLPCLIILCHLASSYWAPCLIIFRHLASCYKLQKKGVKYNMNNTDDATRRLNRFLRSLLFVSLSILCDSCHLLNILIIAVRNRPWMTHMLFLQTSLKSMWVSFVCCEFYFETNQTWVIFDFTFAFV